jgi:hypothetical protein
MARQHLEVERYMVIKFLLGGLDPNRNYYLAIEKVSYQISAAISFLISKFYIIKLLVFYHTDQ